MSSACPQAYIDFAHALADASGGIIRRHFRTPFSVEDKDDASPVTVADREAERAMRALIAERYPGHGIVGEEFGNDRAEADEVWVLDPIDGTRAFVGGKPIFGTLIALLRDGRPLLGIIDQPVLGERWVGAAGTASRFAATPSRRGPAPASSGRSSIPRLRTSSTAPTWMPSRGLPRAFEARSMAGIAMPTDCWRPAISTSSSRPVSRPTTTAPSFPSSRAPRTHYRLGRNSLDAGSDGRVIAAGDGRVHGRALELLSSSTN